MYIISDFSIRHI